MKEIKEIFIKIVRLFLDILLFTYNIIRQVVLPNKKRKGNILSSLFVFFVGVVKKISHFEHRSFQMAIVFNQKYVRKGLFLIGAVLLLLSSFEWMNNERSIIVETNKQIEHFQQTVEKRKNINASDYVASHLKAIGYFSFVNIYYDNDISSSSKRIYLLTHSLRI